MQPAPAATATATDKLPNLVADPPANPQLDYYSYPGGGHDLLLRFDGYVHNAGAGALDVRASRTSKDNPMPPLQRVYRSNGSHHDDAMPRAQLFYSNADGHHHWHLQDIARYSLWGQNRAAMVSAALKVGFCLDDSQHVDSFGGGPVYTDASGRNFCQQNQPDTLSLFEGVSSGWRDIYYSSLALQWVVVSDVQPGRYWLREDVDPDGVIHESNETNAPAWSASAVTIPGYVARAIAAQPSPYGQPKQVTLGTTAYGSPGARLFRVVTPPRHGTLSVATGTDFSSPSVTYTPASGYSGPDQFTYRASDSTSPYPIHPTTATVALTVGAPAPAEGRDRHSSDERRDRRPGATPRDGDERLPGRDLAGERRGRRQRQAGTITASGLYTAPSNVPASGHVTIAAWSSSGAHDKRVVAIRWPSMPPPSPGVHDPHRTRGALLSSIATALQGNVLAAGVTPVRAGVVSIRARVGTRGLGSCKARTPQGRRFTCRLNVPPGLKLDKLTIVAQLIRSHKVVATVRRSGAP